MTEKKKRVSIADRKKRAAYYIQNRTESCPHCEDLPMLIESHDVLAQKNRHLKARIKELEAQLLLLQEKDVDTELKAHNEWLASRVDSTG
jgi:hypothetical protein